MDKVYMALNRTYWYGFATYMGINMLIQDWLGLEGYIAFVREHWVNIHWVIGLLIAASGIFLRVAIMARFSWLLKEKENGNTTST